MSQRKYIDGQIGESRSFCHNAHEGTGALLLSTTSLVTRLEELYSGATLGSARSKRGGLLSVREWIAEKSSWFPITSRDASYPLPFIYVDMLGELNM